MIKKIRYTVAGWLRRLSFWIDPHPLVRTTRGKGRPIVRRADEIVVNK